jgi:hypothetical protein
MNNIVEFTGITTLDIPPDRIIASAANEKFERVVIIGVTEDGDEYFSSSASDGGSVLWDLERAKLKLLTVSIG